MSERSANRPVNLLGVRDVRRLADELGIRPTKQRGQNFVIDPNTVRRIVRTAGLAASDSVLEVGPGLGSLTLGLLEVVGHVVAIEIDDVLAAGLPGTIEAYAPGLASACDVVHADALRLNPADISVLQAPEPTALVANLPYNVAVPVLLHLLEVVPTLRTALVMVQREVADRLAAPPGSRTYGVPSAKAAWYADVQRAGTIGRHVFWPAPNVDSGLVALRRRPAPTADVRRTDVFAVIDAAFATRRKTLRGALASLAGSPDAAESVLRAAGIDPGARGETLGIEEFCRIASVLTPAGGDVHP